MEKQILELLMKMGGRMSNMEEKIDKRFDSLEAKIDELSVNQIN